jgi:hypothetical protein
VKKVKIPKGDSSLRTLEGKVIEAIQKIHGGESVDISEIRSDVKSLPIAEWKIDCEIDHLKAWRNCIPRDRKYYELFEALQPTIFESVLFRTITLPLADLLLIEEKMKDADIGKYEQTKAILNLRGDEKEEYVLACCIYLTR